MLLFSQSGRILEMYHFLDRIESNIVRHSYPYGSKSKLSFKIRYYWYLKLRNADLVRSLVRYRYLKSTQPVLKPKVSGFLRFS